MTDFMALALALARRGEGRTRPNPPVGAVAVRAGEVVGRGWHRRAGGDHAETAALKSVPRRILAEVAAGKGPPLELYVTLEPCSRPGRVGACTDAIAAAGVSRVVYGCADPNPKNRGRAKRALAKAGIACERLAPGDPAAKECRRLVEPFAKHVLTGLPFTTVKIAMSLDGRICDEAGDAKWISSAASRRLAGRLRERADAIMVGAETVRRDDPSLLSHGKPNPFLIRAVVSRSGRLPRGAQVFADGKNETLVFRDAEEAVRELGRRGCLHVVCEGGLRLACSLAAAGLVDEWLTVLAPVAIGSGPLRDATRFSLSSVADPCTGDAFVLSTRRV